MIIALNWMKSHYHLGFILLDNRIVINYVANWTYILTASETWQKQVNCLLNLIYLFKYLQMVNIIKYDNVATTTTLQQPPSYRDTLVNLPWQVKANQDFYFHFLFKINMYRYTVNIDHSSRSFLLVYVHAKVVTPKWSLCIDITDIYRHFFPHEITSFPHVEISAH